MLPQVTYRKVPCTHRRPPVAGQSERLYYRTQVGLTCARQPFTHAIRNPIGRNHPFFALLRKTVGVDPQAFARFRIALGADLLYEIVGRTVSLTAHFSDAGVLPRDSFSPFWRIVPSLFFLSGDVRVQALLCLAAAVAALMLIAGYRTTGATVASWVLYLGMVDRNPLINSGGDHLLRYLLFWSMFVPLGAVASIDERSKERPGAVTPGGRRALIVTGGVAGLKLQIVSVYLFAGLHKLQAPAWHSGVAVTRALQMYTRSTPFGLWLLAFPNALAFATHIIPWLQSLSVPSCSWCRSGADCRAH